MPKAFGLVRLAVVVSLLTAGVTLSSRAISHANKSQRYVPIEFEQNRGQAGSGGLYLAHAQRLLLTMRENGISLKTAGPKGKGAQLDILFANAASHPAVTPDGATGGESNYLTGGDPKSWKTHIPHYRSISYRELYPGIDLKFYGNGPYLEHDFVLAPGADPACIRLRVNGSQRPTLNPKGDLEISVADEKFVLHKPDVYQMRGASREVIDARFVLEGPEVRFAIGTYDSSRQLVIDPALSASTYLADLSLVVSGIATDAAGNSYVTGLSFSDTYPTTSSSYQPHCASCASSFPDVFVTKVNPEGTAQVFSTFLGGSNYDQPFGLAVDSTGKVVVAGYTQSSDFPVRNSIPHGLATLGTSYGFVSSLSRDGASLNYSSLLGGTKAPDTASDTQVQALALDSRGNAFIAGQTYADAFPVTGLNCCQLAYPASAVFVTKILANGALAYSSLVGDPSPQNGGGGLIGVSAIRVGGSGAAFIAGQAGTLWPITPGAYQATIPGPFPYAAPFVTKLSADGTKLLYSTFLGNGAVNGLAIDPSGNAWITGTPNGSDFPVTKNAYQPTPPANSCCVPFFSKLNTTGTKLVYSTYFYGNSDFYGFSAPAGIALDKQGNLWLAGTTSDPQWPLVNPVQSLPAPNTFVGPTGFLARFDPTGTNLTFSTLYSSASPATQLSGLAIDGLGKVHLAGVANDDLYTTPGAFQRTVTPPPPNYNYTYGFSAVIDPNADSGSLCVAFPFNQRILFGAVPIGTTARRTVTFSNCGTASLTMSSFTSTLPEFVIPRSTNNCLVALGPGASCTATILFRPKTLTGFDGKLIITSNSSVPTTTLNLSGSGATPQIVIFQEGLIFDPQFLLQTSPALRVFVMNQGNAPLRINLAQTTISGDFAFTQSGCNRLLQPQQTCFFSLTFTPTAAGQRTGALSIASNDPQRPLVPVSLSGQGYSAYPLPMLISADPPTLPIGAGDVPIRLTGTNFFPASQAYLNGVAQPTSYSNSNSLSLVVPASLLQNFGELRVQVANPTPGGGKSHALTLTLYRSVPLNISDFVYDPISKMIYASVPASAAQYANSVVPINPNTGALGTPISTGADPGHVAVSDNGQYLYVSNNGDNTIQRINLKTRAIERTFPLPVDPNFGQTRASAIRVVPGSPQLLVVVPFLNFVSPPEDGIALYNDQGLVNWLRSGDNGILWVDSFTFTNPSTIYALPFAFPDNFFQSFSIDASGIHSIVSGGGGTYSSTLIASDGKLIYVADGTVWDPVAKKQVGAYTPAPFFAQGIVLDAARNSTYFLNGLSGSGITLQSYDQATFQLKGNLFFPPLSSGIGHLQRWGTNGLAFASGDFLAQTNTLILLKSSL